MFVHVVVFDHWTFKTRLGPEYVFATHPIVYCQKPLWPKCKDSVHVLADSVTGHTRGLSFWLKVADQSFLLFFFQEIYPVCFDPAIKPNCKVLMAFFHSLHWFRCQEFSCLWIFRIIQLTDKNHVFWILLLFFFGKKEMNWAVLSTNSFFHQTYFAYKLFLFLLFVVFLAKEEKRAILFTIGFYFFPKDMFCTYSVFYLYICFVFAHTC